MHICMYDKLPLLYLNKMTVFIPNVFQSINQIQFLIDTLKKIILLSFLTLENFYQTHCFIVGVYSIHIFFPDDGTFSETIKKT